MRSNHRLFLTAFLLLGVAAAGRAGVSSASAVSVQLPYGYNRADGRVAIDPLLVYLVCRDTSTLVIAPDRVASVQSQLGATVGADGSWSLPTGEVLTPQIAQWAIQTASNGETIAFSALAPVPAEEVVMATAPATAACEKKLKKHKCVDFKCEGCEPRPEGGFAKYETGEQNKIFTYCVESKVDTDECVQTGLFKTCIETLYANPGCTAPELESETTNYYSCKQK